eukprot:2201415-Amphidinium_carterae.1
MQDDADGTLESAACEEGRFSLIKFPHNVQQWQQLLIVLSICRLPIQGEKMCRYCFEGEDAGELISPCNCSGGQAAARSLKEFQPCPRASFK